MAQGSAEALPCKKQLFFDKHNAREVNLAAFVSMCVAGIAAIAETGRRNHTIRQHTGQHLAKRDVAHMTIPEIPSSEIRCGLLLKDGIVLIERIIKEPRLSGINADFKWLLNTFARHFAHVARADHIEIRAGIIAQFIININAWKAVGSDYRTSPGLPSSQISEVVRALFHFPEGLIAIGVVVLGIAVLCVFGLRIGWGQNGVTDSDRNLTVSNSGSYGTASFMSPKEASACFEVTSAKRTSHDILGMLPDGQVLTLPKDTRLNANLAVCGSSGTGKSRAISRNLVLQAVKRGESVILTDPKSELYVAVGCPDARRAPQEIF